MNSKLLAVVSFVVWFGACAALPPGVPTARWRVPITLRPLAAAGSTSLRGLAAVDAQVAWVGGAGGALYRTVDGGSTWQDVAPPDTSACDFRDIEAFGRDRAVVMVAGQPAKLFRTDDGGATWQVVLHDERPAAFFDGIAFAGDFGVLLGDPIDGAFCVWTSRDAGRSWAALPRETLPAPLPGEGAFAASGTCVAVGGPGGDDIWVVTGGGERARLLHGGREGVWGVRDLPLRAGDAARGAFSVAVQGAGMLVVGGDYRVPRRSEGSAAWSTDGAASLHATSGGCGGYRSAVAWLDERRAVAVGSHGTSWTADRGGSWKVLDVGGAHSLARGSDGSLWCCGNGGAVARIEYDR